MQLNALTPQFVRFTGAVPANSSRDDKGRERVGEAAAATGAAGAGVSATRSGAFKMFKTSSKLAGGMNAATDSLKLVNQPIKQTSSLWNAFRVNAKQLRHDVIAWAENSKMPGFMKSIFRGGLGKAIGSVAAVFVFTAGVGEIARTFLGQLSGSLANASGNV